MCEEVLKGAVQALATICLFVSLLRRVSEGTCALLHTDHCPHQILKYWEIFDVLFFRYWLKVISSLHTFC